MEKTPTQILLASTSLLLALLILYAAYYTLSKLRRRKKNESHEEEKSRFDLDPPEHLEPEDLLLFQGGENLTAHDILEAPGEVVGKSGYGTLYRARLQRTGAVTLLRFIRPACAARMPDILPAIRILGLARHPNLVPFSALYIGTRGEKLLVHPFYSTGNLSSFLRDGNAESRRWEVIHGLAIGIARGLDYLHCGFQRPIVHGNLKTKNVLLDPKNQPRISDFGLHLLLNPTAGQEMLEASAAEGYRAPELIKMKEASRETDIYSLGVILLELITGREPINRDQSGSLDQSLRTLILENKLSDLVKDQSGRQDGLLMFFKLAMACCSPSPALRPDIRQVVGKLEEMGW